MSNVDYSVTEEEIASFFEKAGCNMTDIAPGRNGCFVVDFREQSDMRKAFMLQDTVLCNCSLY